MLLFRVGGGGALRALGLLMVRLGDPLEKSWSDNGVNLSPGRGKQVLFHKLEEEEMDDFVRNYFGLSHILYVYLRQSDHGICDGTCINLAL